MKQILIDNWKINIIFLIWNDLALPDIQLIVKAIMLNQY